MISSLANGAKIPRRPRLGEGASGMGGGVAFHAATGTFVLEMRQEEGVDDRGARPILKKGVLGWDAHDFFLGDKLPMRIPIVGKTHFPIVRKRNARRREISL